MHAMESGDIHVLHIQRRLLIVKDARASYKQCVYRISHLCGPRASRRLKSCSRRSTDLKWRPSASPAKRIVRPSELTSTPPTRARARRGMATLSWVSAFKHLELAHLAELDDACYIPNSLCLLVVDAHPPYSAAFLVEDDVAALPIKLTSISVRAALAKLLVDTLVLKSVVDLALVSEGVCGPGGGTQTLQALYVRRWQHHPARRRASYSSS